MTTFQAVVHSILHGFAEFLPISASAHHSLIAYVMGWPAPEGAAYGGLALGATLPLAHGRIVHEHVVVVVDNIFRTYASCWFGGASQIGCNVTKGSKSHVGLLSYMTGSLLDHFSTMFNSHV